MIDSAQAPTRRPVTLTRAKGLHYLEFLAEMHDMRRPDWYLEVGTARGQSLALARCASIAIDPAFRLDRQVTGSKPELHLFQSTSDAAFASARMAALAPRVDIAFLDGLHLFDVLLRDFVNVERLMAPGGVIAVHDTRPFTLEMTARRPSPGSAGWTGDVWKLLPILAECRPDLTIRHVGCRPTGLTLIRGRWGGNDALERDHERIVARWMEVSLEHYGPDRYAAQFPLIGAEAAFLELAE